MPEGRILLKSISESRKLSELKTDGARLLYTWLLPHVDIRGCYSGDSVIIKGKIFTRLDKSPKEIETYLQDMQRVHLILRYEHNGDTYLQIPDFVEKQPKLRADREAKPKIPTPDELQITPDQLHITSRLTPDEFQINSPLSKVKQSKVKVKSIHLDCIELTEDEYKKLKTRYGDEGALKAIEILNNYKMKSGKTYKSDYHALLEDWVKEKIDGTNTGYIRPGYKREAERYDPELEAGIRKAQELERRRLEKRNAQEAANHSNVTDG